MKHLALPHLQAMLVEDEADLPQDRPFISSSIPPHHPKVDDVRRLARSSLCIYQGPLSSHKHDTYQQTTQTQARCVCPPRLPYPSHSNFNSASAVMTTLAHSIFLTETCGWQCSTSPPTNRLRPTIAKRLWNLPTLFLLQVVKTYGQLKP